MSFPEATLPLAPIRILSRSPVPTKALWMIINPSVSGSPTLSSRTPVAPQRIPPSAPSTMMKSERHLRPFGQHRLAGRQHIDPGTDTQLEAHRFSAGQFAQPRDEHDQFARGVKRRMRRRADTLFADRHLLR